MPNGDDPAMNESADSVPNRKPDRSGISADWSERGFTCEHWTDPPGRCWENFTHETDELIVVLQGQMEFEIEGVVYHPAPGEELRIPAHQRHSARNIGQSTAHWLFGYLQEP